MYFYEVLPKLHEGAQGQPLAASTVKGLMSNLSQCFEMRGQSGPWDAQTHSGNPVHSQEVRRAQEAYGNKLPKQGVRERSAPPMRWEKIKQMVGGINEALALCAARAEGAATEEVQRHVRDSAFLLCMWHTMHRGQDCLYLDWEHVYLETGTGIHAVQKLWTVEDAPVDGTLVLVPRASKTEHRTRPRSQLIVSSGQTDPMTCGVLHLRRYFAWQTVANGGSVPTGPVFKATTGRGERLSATGAGNRVKTLLRLYSVDEGETMHGIRRGTVQHAVQSAVSDDQIMRAAGMVSRDTLQRYQDRGRHLS